LFRSGARFRPVAYECCRHGKHDINASDQPAGNQRRRSRRNQRRQRRVAEYGDHGEPDRRHDTGKGTRKSQHHPESRGHALATLEAQREWEDVAEEGGQPRRRDGRPACAVRVDTGLH